VYNYGMSDREPTPQLRAKYKKFATSVIEGNTIRQSAIDAGYAPGRASEQGSRLMRNTTVRQLFEREFKKIGAGRDFWANKVRDGAEANDDKGNPDWRTREGYINMALRIWGALSRDGEGEHASTQNVMIQLVQAAQRRGLDGSGDVGE